MKLIMEMNFSACVLYLGGSRRSTWQHCVLNCPESSRLRPVLGNHLKSHLAEREQVFHKGVGYDPSSTNLIRNYTKRLLSPVSQKG